jgi:hypothetical protein
MAGAANSGHGHGLFSEVYRGDVGERLGHGISDLVAQIRLDLLAQIARRSSTSAEDNLDNGVSSNCGAVPYERGKRHGGVLTEKEDAAHLRAAPKDAYD